MALREDFPPAGSDYMGGESDGYEYRTVFAGSNLESTYEMVRQFLKEEGDKAYYSYNNNQKLGSVVVRLESAARPRPSPTSSGLRSCVHCR